LRFIFSQLQPTMAQKREQQRGLPADPGDPQPGA
jgi:hypothetical protein